MLCNWSDFDRFAQVLVSPRRRFVRELDAADSGHEVQVALLRYVARSCRLPTDVDVDRLAGHFRATSQPDVAIELERLASECQRMDAGLPAQTELSDLKGQVDQFVSRLRESGRDAGPAAMRRAAVASLLIGVCGSANASEQLTEHGYGLSAEQQATLLKEAVDLYDSVDDSDNGAAAKEVMLKVSERLGALVQADTADDRLLFNLATAQLRAGKVGLAIANLRRALRVDPENARYHRRLAVADRLARIDREESTRTWLDRVREAVDRSATWVGLRYVRYLALFGWAAAFLMPIPRLFGYRYPWKMLSAALLLVAVLAAAAYCRPRFVLLARFERHSGRG